MTAMVDVASALREVPPEALAVALAIACLVAVLQTARIYATRAFARRRLRLRMDHAADGETRAEALLIARGYAVVGRQVSTSYEVAVDGEAVAIALRADYLVEALGCTYIAEVKTGERAPRVETPGTRRQLLEYRVAFDVDGVLLVDVDAERIQLVTFPLGGVEALERSHAGEAEPRAPIASPVALLLGGLTAGAVAMAAALSYFR